MVGSDEFDPHSLDQEAFLSEVHSFEFWFQAVEGYLSDRPYGHPEDMADDPASIVNRDGLVTILCNYCVGEMAALEASSGMVRLAPNSHSRIFMATQVADEARHLEVFEHRLVELGVDDPEAEVARRANPQIVEFKRRLLELVDDGDWEASVFAQNVLLETMEYTVFRHHAQTADPVTAATLEGVISDERRHLGFGENDIGRRLMEDPSERARLLEVRRDLDPLVLGVFDAVFDDLSIPSVDRPRLGGEYLDAVERLGLTA
jgi:1,2-phenylacetyl-CoA epoxidase catalytic subunit